MSVSVDDLPLVEAVYTFVDNAGQATHIASSSLRRALEGASWPVSVCEIGGTLVTALENGDLGVEEDHAKGLPDAALETPLIVCAWGEADHVIADGAHRLWRRWKRGDDDFTAYMVPEAVWRQFTIHDMPGSGAFWDAFNRNAKVR